KVVVVEQHRERGGIRRLGAAEARDVVEDVNGNHLGADVVRLAVPVVKYVKPFLPRAVIEWRQKRLERIQSHVLTEAGQRLAEWARFGKIRDEMLPHRVFECTLEEHAGFAEVCHD